MKKDEIIALLSTSFTESNCIEFKSDFELKRSGDLIEVIKDVIAISNSGGGGIAFGIYDDGTPAMFDNNKILKLDLADITNKIRKYINKEFDALSIEKVIRGEDEIACFVIEPSQCPIIFENPGTYELENSDGKQKTAFGKGTVYFRHGSKSETANNYDIMSAINTEIERIKHSWLGNIKRVVEAPIGHIVQMVPPNVVQKDSPDAKAIRFTDEADAPVYRIDNPDLDCPYRTKEVVQKLNVRLNGRYTVNQWDIQVIQAIHTINEKKPNFYFKSRFGPKQFSDAFIDWVVENFENDKLFFTKARQKYKRGI